MKYEARKGGTGNDARLCSQTEAADLYEMQRKSAPQATKGEVVRFLIEHDGSLEPEFKAKVQTYGFTYLRYARAIRVSLTDPGYQEAFYALTGKNLNISPDHINVWAKDIAKAMIDQPDTSAVK